jgi:hypothetical protein
MEEWKIADPSSGRRPLKGEVGYGKMGKWKNGRMEEWKNGMMEKWKDGKMK